jgi:hypothetical protein
MEARVAVAVAALAVAAGCIGIADEEPLDADAADAGEPPRLDEPSREALVEHRVPLEREGPGWTATRINVTPGMWNVDEWDDDGGSATITFLHHRTATDEPPVVGPAYLLGSAIESGSPWVNLNVNPVPAGENVTGSTTFYVSCSGGGCDDAPPRLEYVPLVGLQQPGSTASVSVGLPEDPEGDLPEQAASLDERPPARLEAPIEGEAVRGGTYLHAVSPALDEPLDVQVGDVDVDEDRPAPGPEEAHAGTQHAMAFDAELPRRGHANALLVGLMPAAATAWEAGWSLPATAGQRAGVYGEAGPASAGTIPLLALSVETEPGEATARLDRTIAGAQAPDEAPGVLGILEVKRIDAAIWGYLSGDLPGDYGWPWEDTEVAGSPVPSPGLGPVPLAEGPTPRAVTCSAALPTCLQDAPAR